MFNQSITCSTFNQMSFQIHFKNSEIKNTTLEILDTVRRVGAKGFLVGGCIRDALLDIPAKDIDIEVYGLELKKLEFILKEKFLLNYVGCQAALVLTGHGKKELIKIKKYKKVKILKKFSDILAFL